MKIQRKLAIGYTIIVALIGGIVYTYLHEWRQMNRLEREVKEITNSGKVYMKHTCICST